MPSLKASMQESAGGGFAKKARGFRGKDAVKGGWWVGVGWSVSWMDIMASPARVKHPAPIETFAERQRTIRRAEAEEDREAEMWAHDMGGRVEGL